MLRFADRVIEALLKLVKAALTGLEQFIETPLDELPVIGPLIGVIESILGIDPSQVTITGVFCLVAAIPVTLAYKLTTVRTRVSSPAASCRPPPAPRPGWATRPMPASTARSAQPPFGRCSTVSSTWFRTPATWCSASSTSSSRR